MFDNKGKFEFNFRTFYIFLSVIVCIFILFGLYLIIKSAEDDSVLVDQTESMTTDTISIEIPTEENIITVDYPSGLDEAVKFDSTIASKYAVLIDLTDNKVIAQRDADKKMYPASMTKIMTLIVAVENMNSLDDKFTMTYEILNPLINADASRAGFEENETITIKDMLYGSILPSGADATVGLAEAICGSEENFVSLMNEKANEMGLHNTHFTNTSGLHDENHYSTALDMAVILNYAIQDDLCREILSTYQYTTSKTKEHPEGILLESTMFSRMYGDEVENVKIEGGKTGYTSEAQHCIASFASKDNKEYIAVAAKEDDKWGSVYDIFDIYEKYLP
ncbi:D-alanyl-D-alanine carboxypeptidase family protein [Porcipelethomonas sp.]|uniref:D-alanyl-D-alanine carboxypeptidase family protein n=1 Tax=Porcipelethomonas sp. TaxID=2981675 RepID=UPI003EF1F47D